VADTNAATVALANNLLENTRELRLLFRYPMLPNGSIGRRRMSFRTLADGSMVETAPALFFIQPSTYVQAQ
jgi:hypothetical protein